MRKHTKGAIAAGFAAVLLLGGASTLAYWSDSATGAGGKINSGSMSLTAGQSGDWTYAGTDDVVGAIVPGDSIQKTFDFTISADGDHLKAALDTPDSVNVTATGSPTTLKLDVESSFQIDGAAAPATITEANDGDVVTATVTVDFPYGSETVNGNDTQNLEASLDDITVWLTQVDPNA
ncbi:alternate-type signal peptide domain-containing protein [Microlunatus soli]|uniref:Alternate signal-mediated exported protein, RER_14450 family n=1 Tax=Microlunatus soli TaxID=630515 RepID=A0A1H1R0X1_9ACTN|nr:alternate-type signal peptide domain-containing protein [Microlunatus soli]SDS29155.1 alternate signal-mediated exported protein, RER_14450 family [Microlunatus soli]